MANRKKRPVPEADAADLEAFASFVRAEERKERDAKQAAREERRQADQHAKLVQAKEEAAAQVKRLRGSERATAEQKADADAAYKAALAALVAAETGAAPAWAPPVDEPTEAEEASQAEEPADGEEPAAESTDAESTDAEAPSAVEEPEGAPEEPDPGQ